ncbi:beta-ketoacyl-ACP synthase III [Coprobacter tertius]|uniref:Beta-ketoacyl-[acyl-carrier-protein] synthase III n=1 Tax=Coprobacter tertius TaxID=2944915 RepID=A0ABT1MIU6_9BACT|nr:beta-ketoacyl-ACP synthase III [Coprobacter tertius]MCP9612545.1 ketoacyl-ACP synthase III [Coprobacter tertius]
MQNAVITGVASYVPDYVLTNEELSQMVDTNDEWITTRVGIKERRILKGEGMGSSELGYRAVNELLEKTRTKADDIELVICATSNPDYRFPSTASIIAEKSGLKHCFGYDIQAACAGFIVALQAGAAYVKSGLYKKVIVLAAEKMSSMTNYTDRSTCPLFGDAAAAVLLEPTDEDTGVIDAVFRTDGIGLPHLIMKAGGSAYPATHESIDNMEHYVYQEGRAVYKHAVSDMLEASLEVMKRNNLDVNTLDWFIPHQANARIIEAIAGRIEIDPKKVVINIEKYGNTSAASIPLCLSEWEDKFKKGDNLVLAAFGAGFTWGAVFLKWGYNKK